MIIRIALAIVVLGVTTAAAWILPRLQSPPSQFEVAQTMLADGRAREAVHLFEDPVWKGIAEYRADRLQRSLVEFLQTETTLTLYNTGNAYARLHEWRGAVAAYERVLRLNPSHADARHNLEVVQRAKEAERRLVEEMRKQRKIGRWKDGDRLNEQSDEGGSNQTVNEDIDKGTGVAAEEETSASGTSANMGRLGDEQLGNESLAGNAPDDDPDAERKIDGALSATGVVLMRESAQAADILLKRIVDNPERVLRARFRAIHKKRTEGLE